MIWIALYVLLGAFLLTLILFKCFFYIIVIDGNSMYPTFKSGDICLAKRINHPENEKFKVGDIYVYVPPYTQEKSYLVVKRLVESRGNLDLYFKGDNAKESYDSRAYGWVSYKNVKAKILLGGSTHAE